MTGLTGVYLFIGGGVFGAAVVLVLQLVKKREAKEIARELVSEAEVEKVKDLEVFLGRVKDSLGSMSFDALKKTSEEFLKLAESVLGKQTQSGEKELEGKKKLIDQSLESMRGDLQKMQDLVCGFEKDRVQKKGEL